MTSAGRSVAKPNIHDVWVTRGNFDRTDPTRCLYIVEDRFPSDARVGGLPYATTGHACIKDPRLTKGAGYCGDSSPPERADISPNQPRIKAGINRAETK